MDRSQAQPDKATTATAPTAAAGTTTTSTHRTIKKRAGRACTSCRSRKVRCDVVRSGGPCTNCRLDSLECIVPRSRRHKVAKSNKSNVQPSPAAAAVPATDPNIVLADGKAYQPHIGRPRHHQQGSQGHTTSTLKNHDATQYPPSAPTLSGHGHGHVNITEAGQEGRYEAPPPDDLANFNARPPLPTFIKPLPEELDQADLRYLHEKGALTLPTASFRQITLARYLEFAHPLLPMLDRNQIISTIMGHDDSAGRVTGQPISLLLLQAILCSGVTFVESDSIVDEGFESKQAARRAFFHRAKVLFDCNAEQDRLVAAQAAALMSSWYPGKKEKKDSWYWIGTAVSLAYSIGLHLEPDDSRFDRRDCHLRRRLWWCIYDREQKIALALGRPARITYHNVAMLTPEDFEDDGKTDHSSAKGLGDRPIEAPHLQPRDIYDDRTTTQDTLLARLCIQHTKLCVCIAHFVATIFECRQQAESGDQEDEDGRPLPSPSARLQSCAQDFGQWYREMPADLRYEVDAATSCFSQYNNTRTQPHQRSLIVHKATVHVTYYVAISALYRLKALSPSSTWRDRTGSESHGASQRILRHAAWELTHVNQDLYQAGLLRYVSTSAVGSVVAAVVVHLLDVNAPNNTVSRAAVQAIQQCREFLLILQEAYGTAADALEYLDEAVRNEAELSASEEHRENQGPQSPNSYGAAGGHHRDVQDPLQWHDFNMQQRTRNHQQTPTIQAAWRSSPAAVISRAASAAGAQVQRVPSGLEMPPLPDADEMFWQSYLNGVPSYDLFAGFSLPHFDLGVSPNDSSGFNMADVFPEG